MIFTSRFVKQLTTEHLFQVSITIGTREGWVIDCLKIRYLSSALGFTCENCICSSANVKIRELSMGKKQTILKPREQAKINQSCCTNIGQSTYNNLESPEKERTHWSNRHRTGRPRGASRTWWQKHCESCEETRKAGSQRHDCQSQSAVQRGLGEKKYTSQTQDSNHSSAKKTHDGRSKINSEVYETIIQKIHLN